MSKCKEIEPIGGCWIASDGSLTPIVIHYTYIIQENNTEIVESVRYTNSKGQILSIPTGDVVESGNCHCQLMEHYLCIDGVKVPVWVTLNPKNHDVLLVTNTLDLSIVNPSFYINGFIDPCSDCI